MQPILDDDDKIGVETTAGQGWLIGYIVFYTAMMFALGLLFGAYII